MLSRDRDIFDFAELLLKFKQLYPKRFYKIMSLTEQQVKEEIYKLQKFGEIGKATMEDLCVLLILNNTDN